jgi:uncharacterized membrane protein
MAVVGLPETMRDRLSVRAPTMDDPWQWLQAGWRDTWRQPGLSLGYGCAFVLVGLAVTAGLWASGLESLIPVFAAGFTLLGPVLAAGLYEISRKHEAGEKATLVDAAVWRLARPGQIAFLSYSLMFLFLIWLRVATLLYALFVHDNYMPIDEFAAFVLTTSQGLSMLMVGTAVGAVLAFIAFAISALSVPILLRHDIDAISAMATSVRTVVRYPGPMLLWAWLVAVLIALGMMTMFIGLIVVFPLVGHATWHAYRALIKVEA